MSPSCQQESTAPLKTFRRWMAWWWAVRSNASRQLPKRCPRSSQRTVGIPQLLRLHDFSLISSPHTPVSLLLLCPKAEFGSWEPEDKVSKAQGDGGMLCWCSLMELQDSTPQHELSERMCVYVCTRVQLQYQVLIYVTVFSDCHRVAVAYI